VKEEKIKHRVRRIKNESPVKEKNKKTLDGKIDS
jgi:hypothetical protein